MGNSNAISAISMENPKRSWNSMENSKQKFAFPLRFSSTTGHPRSAATPARQRQDTSNCNRIGQIWIENHHFPGAIPHYLCILIEDSPENLAFILQFEYCWAPSRAIGRPAFGPAIFIILNTKFLIFNTKFLVCNTKFLVLNTTNSSSLLTSDADVEDLRACVVPTRTNAVTGNIWRHFEIHAEVDKLLRGICGAKFRPRIRGKLWCFCYVYMFLGVGTS